MSTKLIKVGKLLTIYLSDKTVINVENATDEDKDFILSASDTDIKMRYSGLAKDFNEKTAKLTKAKELVKQSKIVEFSDGKYTIPSLSPISAPKYLVKRIMKAELDGDTDKITSYLNFWTLLCQNPNEKARNNLLWFLVTHGFKILKSGLFVSYRNVVSKEQKSGYYTEKEVEYITTMAHNIKKVQKKSLKNYYLILDKDLEIVSEKVLNKRIKTEGLVAINLDCVISELNDLEDEVVFTDARTQSMRIKLGEPVVLDRALCDEDSSRSCSAGLHLAKKDWSGLSQFGNTTIMCLCNPANVVAVPKEDTYGKIRTCEYFPVEVVTYENNKIVETIEDGDELDYFKVSYDGLINESDADEFKMEVPEPIEINMLKTLKTLEEIQTELKNNKRV